MHAEAMPDEDGVIMAGQLGPRYRTPKQLGQYTQNVYVRIEDFSGRYERAVKCGPTVLVEPSGQFCGDRRYGIEDPEGHRWYFAQGIAATVS
jgi:uncharacterized glyoxalase superfamily protein PhnB